MKKPKQLQKSFEQFSKECIFNLNSVCNIWSEGAFSCKKENCPIFNKKEIKK